MAGFEGAFQRKREWGQAEQKRPVAVGLAVVAACIVLAAGWVFGGGQSFKVATASETHQALAAEQPVAPTPVVICVHVTGAVAAPGVYELPEGSRVSAAVEAAGGFAEGAAVNALNLARVAADGEQIIVPLQSEIDAAASAAGDVDAALAVASGSAGILAGKVNINAATAEELDTLPGIGESTAAKIIADREANGPFASAEDLKRVSGIGDKKYAALADAICVG